MVNIEPHIEVYDVKRIKQIAYGNAGKLAVIGAFPCGDDTQRDKAVALYTDYNEARNALKGDYRLEDDNSIENHNKDPVPRTYVSFYCLDYIFYNSNQSKGAESVVIVNTNYGKQKANFSQQSNNDEIANACLLLADEDFDILNIAENTTLVIQEVEDQTTVTRLNPIWETLKDFERKQFKDQKPFGLITGINLENATDTYVTEFKRLWNDKGIYKAVVTPIRLNGSSESLNIAESGSWHANFTAGRPVNRSETGKVYDDLMGENSKETFPLTNTITWKTLLNNGFFTTKYKNRRLLTLQCLSNITPADYDMKIERIKNYMIKRLTLADYLGEDNDRITRGMIKGKFEYEKNLAIKNNYLIDMEYNFEVIDTETIKANLKLYISDIIRVIQLDVTVEISAYEEV